MATSRVIETFLDLVRIDSPSRYEADCAQYCAEVLTDAGCSVAVDDSASVTGSNTGNLIADLPGTAPGILILSAHMDVVDPAVGVKPVIRDGRIYSDGTTVLGGDDKSGLAAAIEVVRRLAEKGGAYPTVRCLFTVQEEVGLQGVKALDLTAAQGDVCLVLDADGTPGGIVIGAPTHITFKATFTGCASHAGVAPEQGISAIAMAAEAISRMRLGRLDEITTANVGTVHGGTADNVIAATCTITGECRSLKLERALSVKERMDSAMREAAAEYGGAVDVAWVTEYEGFLLPEDHPDVAIVAAACSDIGIASRTFTSGGGSDANVLASLGVPTVALSCGMTGVHSTDEEIAVADIETLADLVEAVARRMAS